MRQFDETRRDETEKIEELKEEKKTMEKHGRRATNQIRHGNVSMNGDSRVHLATAVEVAQ